MKIKRALKAMKDIFPNSSVSVNESIFYHHFSSEPVTKTCSVYYSFHHSGCSSKSGETFEDCFEQLKDEANTINEVIVKYSILLRKFN